MVDLADMGDKRQYPLRPIDFGRILLCPCLNARNWNLRLNKKKLYTLSIYFSHSTFFFSWKHSIVLSIPKTNNFSSLSSFLSLSYSSFSSQSSSSISASHSLMSLSQILISFPSVSLIFVDLTVHWRNYFTSLMSCFVISTIVALLSSLCWTS